MLPIVPFDVLLPLALGAVTLVFLLSALILLRRAFIRWWSEGGERQRRAARALILGAMDGGDVGRLTRWVSRGRPSRIRVFLEGVERIRDRRPGVDEWVQTSGVSRVLARSVRTPTRRLLGGRLSWGRWRKVSALLAIGELRLPEHEALLAALDDPDSEVAYAAAEAIATVDFPRGARAIFRRIGPTSPLLDSRLATVLENMTAGVHEVLEEGLSQDDPRVLYWTLTLIGRKRVFELVDSIRPHLGSPDPNIRAAGCKSLGLLGVRLTDRWMEPLLQDPAWFVQAQAVKALGRMKAVWAAWKLAGLLTSPHWWVRQNATQALIELGEEAEEAVAEVLGSEDRYARHSAVEVLARVGWVEARVIQASRGGEEAREILTRYGRSGGLGHLENALQEVPGPAVPFLLALLEELGDDATYGRIRAARYRFPPELQVLFIESARRVRSG